MGNTHRRPGGPPAATGDKWHYKRIRRAGNVIAVGPFVTNGPNPPATETPLESLMNPIAALLQNIGTDLAVIVGYGLSSLVAWTAFGVTNLLGGLGTILAHL
jgi:hypothetical protein